jgi:hypothetical protein
MEGLLPLNDDGLNRSTDIHKFRTHLLEIGSQDPTNITAEVGEVYPPVAIPIASHARVNKSCFCYCAGFRQVNER